MTSGNSTQLDIELRYAWDWFHYHSSQRLMAFNFFLILMSAVTVAYSSAVTGDSELFGATVATIGCVVSVGFFVMDVRNAELVEYGRHALQTLEVRHPTLPKIRTWDKCFPGS